MAHIPFAVLAMVLAMRLSPSANAQGALRDGDISFRNEVEHAIEKGADFLKTTQSSSGWWSTNQEPAITALALTAFIGEPKQRDRESAQVKAGYRYLGECVKADGGIYVTQRAVFNTACAMIALAVESNVTGTNNGAILRQARAFLVRQQTTNRSDPLYHGGFPAETGAQAGDVTVTALVLEALALADPKETGSGYDRSAAARFVQGCQREGGGFLESPPASGTNGIKPSLRPTGSATAAGVLGFLDAGTKPADSQVKAAIDWLAANFSLDENPGLGREHYFLYLHLLARALDRTGLEQLATSGQRVDWRRELAMKLINRQNRDGSWTGERPPETDANVATAHALIALEVVYQGL